MTTAFKKAIALCGFSNREAAEFLRISVRTIESYAQDRRTPPVGIMAELGELYNRMLMAADETAEEVESIFKTHEIEPEHFDLEIISSGINGQWPCQSTALAVEAMVRLQLAYLTKSAHETMSD